MSMKNINFRTFLLFSLVSLTLTVSALLVSLALLAAGLNKAATDIGENAAPAVIELADADSTLMTLRGLLEDRLEGRGEPRILDARIALAQQSLNANIDLYLSLPAFPGEPELSTNLRESLADVNRIASLVKSESPSDPSDPNIERELSRATDRLGGHLDEVGRFNARFLGALSHRIGDLRRTALPVAILVDILGFAAAAASVTIAFVLVQRFAHSEAVARKQLEDKANELDAFAVQVAHDLLSPLMSTNLALVLAREKMPPNDEKAKEIIQRATSSLGHVRMIVDGLLEFARAGAQPLKGARANIKEVLREVGDSFAPLAERGGIELHVAEPCSEHIVATTPGVLTSLLTNLIQNAMRAVAGRDTRRIHVRVTEREPKMIRVEVEDSGPGVTPELQPLLFQPQKQQVRVRGKNSPGLGLGLATVKKLADSYGGSVGFQSRTGEGSTFWFVLPVEEALPA